MEIILLETIINAPVDRCFDLSRSIELHQVTTRKTKERAVGGKTEGLIEKGEYVTWEATHLFIRQNLTVEVSELVRPQFFVTKMLKGAFKTMHHKHIFINMDNQTKMLDEFTFQSPCGMLGRLVDRLFLKKYMRHFLRERNRTIKHIAESEEWKKFLILC